MSVSKIFLYFCLFFVGGIFLSSVFKISQQLALSFLIIGLILISVFWRRKKNVVFGFCIIFLALGIFRHQLATFEIDNSMLEKYNNSDQKVTLIGYIFSEPDIKEKTQSLILKCEQIIINEEKISISGKILMTLWKYPEYRYGDKLKAEGILKSPSQDISGFNYRDYLLKDGIYSTMEWPEIEVVGKDYGNIFYRYLFSFKNNLKESINRSISPPQSALLEALLFGDEGNFSKEWKDKFNITGTRHITAVSGMNITIICFLIMNFLLFLGLWRSQAFCFSVFLIALYILMIGAPVSGVRAGIMGIIFMAGQYFGRISFSSRAIVFAAVIMLLMNPLLLRLDVGFQLSFLAVMGMIYLQPFFSEILKKIPNNFQIRYSLATTLSAQIFTLPILIYNFGRIPLLGVITNILIVPILSFVTIFGFIFSFLGIFFQLLGQILSWPAWLILTYIIKTIDFFARLNFTSLTIGEINWVWLIVFYIVLGIVIWRLKERQRLRFLNY